MGAPHASILSEGHYRQLITLLNEGFALVRVLRDDHGTPADIMYLECNSAFLHLTGTTEETLIGKTIAEVFPQTGPELRKSYTDIFSSGKPAVVEWQSSVTRRHYRLSVHPLDDDLLAIIAQDNSQLRETLNSLRERNAQLSFILNSSREWIWNIDSAGVITYSNMAIEKILGYRFDEIIGRAPWDMIVEEDLPAARQVVAHGNEFRTGWSGLMLRWKHKDGSIRYLESCATPIIDNSRIVTGFRGSDIDITERIYSEQSLKGSADKFRTLVNSSFDVIFVLDMNGVFKFVSPAWEKHFGYEVEHVLEHSFVPFVHPDDTPPLLEYLVDVMAKGKSATSPPYRVRRADGSWCLFIANGTPYEDEHGEYLYIGVGRDLSEQKKAEDERIQLERKLLHTQKLESLGVLAGGIAHDFNNLLMTMMANMELAALEVTRGQAATHLHQAAVAASRAADLTNRLLAYSGKGSFVITRLNLARLVEENASLFRTAVSRTISITYRLSKKQPDFMGDSAQIQQVIMNLITNAAESFHESPGRITLATSVRRYNTDELSASLLAEKPAEGLFTCLRVSDNGCGMSKEVVEKIFDPFFTTKFTGRGLGMSAVLGIIRAHRGAIFITTVPGGGTTVRIVFPVAVGLPAPSPESPPAVPAGSGADVPLSGTVLAVDDEKSVLRVCAVMLRQCGYTVITAKDGIEAVDMFRKRSGEIDLVLMDLTMPNMDGIEAMQQMRRIQPDIRIILSSGFNEQELDEQTCPEKPNGFIRKPYTLATLRTELCRVVTADP